MNGNSSTMDGTSQHFTNPKVAIVYENIKKRDPDQYEYLQTAYEILFSLQPLFVEEPNYLEVLPTLFEPERVISFRVPWVDDNFKQQVNRGFRVQFSSAIGPYKGGLRFHPTVNLSIMKFLACEQIFKNSLTTLAMGGAKGGSDFDPKGKSDNEIKSFCQSFMTSLAKHIGKDTDVPAGDIGVGSREIGFLFGQYKRLSNVFDGTITGKNVEWGGSLLRPEATGYGAVYFFNALLKYQNTQLDGMSCVLSGSGNVSQYAALKLISMNAKVLTLSDSDGYLYMPNGFTKEQVEYIMKLKNVDRQRLSSFPKDMLEESNGKYFEGQKPWSVNCEAAFPCATQNEINIMDAQTLYQGGCKYVVEGANMPTSVPGIEFFGNNGVILCPGKAANAGGVAVSGYEMAQNSMRVTWSAEEVDQKLKEVMEKIFDKCQKASLKYTKDPLNLVAGANIAGFIKVADSLLSEGLI